MSTNGYDIEPQEAAALLDATVGDILATETDPLACYTRLTAEQRRYEQLVSDIKRLRGQQLDRMNQDGATQEQIATATGLGTQQRVGQLIKAGRASL